jgi:hypothetical protein
LPEGGQVGDCSCKGGTRGEHGTLCGARAWKSVARQRVSRHGNARAQHPRAGAAHIAEPEGRVTRNEAVAGSSPAVSLSVAPNSAQPRQFWVPRSRRTCAQSRMVAPGPSPASNTSGSMPRETRCAAAASPTGPAPITATGRGGDSGISGLLRKRIEDCRWIGIGP